MDALLTTAASGLRARMESLEMLSNNLANATSAGFKSDREFYSTYVAPEALDGPEGSFPAVSPVIEKNWTDFTQGTVVPTGNALDFSLIGHGFFVVDTPTGPMYTRNGNFRLQKDGRLTTQAGDALRGQDGKPIRLDPAITVEVDDDGTLRQAGQVTNRLTVVDMEDRAKLIKAGATYFRYDNPSKPPVPARPTVEQGRLENANFQPAEAAVRLVSVMRQFETLQKAIAMGNDMNRRAIEDVARIRE